MKKNIIIILSLSFIIVLMASVLIFMQKDKPLTNYTEDEIKFKNEYESLNDKEIEDEIYLKNITIESDNNVKYIYDDEIINLLTNGTNIIYLGWAESNYSRTILPELLSVLKENNIETLYYYNFKDLKSAYENNNDEKKIEIYEKIVEIIGEDIDTYYEEEDFLQGKKKIVAPLVIFVKNGHYIGMHSKSVESQTNSYMDLSKEQKQELQNIYRGYINLINQRTCELETAC